jgi:hypothetical protein
VGVTAAEVLPVGGSGASTIGPDSPILPPMASYSTVNQYTRHYYLIRSYMHRFEAAGGGELILGPGRYAISSTIYVPSNVTIRLSAGTTLVKTNTTGTSQFSASSSMFMLIRPSLGKVTGAVGGHDGDANITIAGAGSGQSVIDMDWLQDTLAIIAGHNRNVTISGISFRHMNNNHFIEMDGCANCTIADNEFIGSASGTRDTAEAINLDTPDPRTGGFSSPWSKQDATPNEGVTISGNRFERLQRAFGTHNFSAGRYHRDVVVRGNVLTTMYDDGIHIMNWANPVFEGNQIAGSPGGAGIRACGTINPTITGNTFSESRFAVVFRSCSGENGTTAANQVTAEGVTALRANSVGAGLGSPAVSVPDAGTVYFNGYEPPPTPPGSVYPGQPTWGDGTISVTWSPAYADPRAPVTGYQLQVAATWSGPALRTVDLGPDATMGTIAGLANGTAYYVAVIARSAVGDSSPIWRGPVTPIGLPGVPVDVRTRSDSPGWLTVTWAQPASNGGSPITGFRVWVWTDAGGSVPAAGSPVTTSAPTWTFAGLPKGQVWVQVAALTSAGEGPRSALVVATVG